ncbi:MAG: metallophosphoesterase [Anaerolineae bacterium]|nr:metallophosphoesterase [Anaerolineae bacterium]
MDRFVDLTSGKAFVVTDLHGEWEPYQRICDRFLELYHQGEADYLIFLGDLIHRYDADQKDYSVQILLDIMRLQAELGHDRVLALLGNHELPHIYGVPLSKGELAFTPRFEHALGSYREAIVDFLKSLPFMVRTTAGVMLIHAGASARTAVASAADLVKTFSHDDFIAEVDKLIARDDIGRLLQSTFNMSQEEYLRQSWYYLAVQNPDDPRYLDMLRGIIASNLEPEWPILWEFFFSQCEGAVPGRLMYGKILERFLEVYSAPEVPQQVLVSGHIVVKGGYEIVTDQQLRLASWAHARPHEAGSYLLFDVAEPVQSASDLKPHVHRLF